MKSFFLYLLLPLAVLSGCETERDATTSDVTDAMEPQDRPANVSDPNRATTATPAPGARDAVATREAQSGAPTTPGEGGAAMHAVAEIMPTSGNQARGAIRLSGVNGMVQIAGTITGLPPGAHGFHIHEVGDCSAPDASSAGDHFNPHDDPHGSPRDLENAHHVGDLGNLTANEQGEAEIDMEDNEMQLSGPESVIGKAIVVHADQDDLKSQPSGNSGARIGCGTIVETATQG
jgi:Cu-Zn family superoxide dismutase